MFRWVEKRVSRQAAAIVLLATLLGGLGLQALLWALGREPAPWAAWAGFTAAGGAMAVLLTYLLVEKTIGRRLKTLTSFLAQQTEQHDDLRRLPPLGTDEVGRAAAGTNALLASLTGARVSMIDQSRELRATREELRLKDALAAKTEELERRFGERRLLFDILRASTRRNSLSDVLDSLAPRLAEALRLRELAILVREGDHFVVRAVHGFDDETALVGRVLGPHEGIASEVADAREPVVVRDVAAEPDYLAFWGHAKREGSFAAVPICHGDRNIGIVAMTRPPEDVPTPVEVRFLSAIADTIALAVHRAQLFDELRELSTHDALTGLANRRLFDQQLAMELERSRRFETELAVLALDLDHFKSLNDRCGHQTGDVALASVAGVLIHGVRKVDTVARTGGEEFVVLLPKTDVEQAVQVADKLREKVESLEIAGMEGQPTGRLTVSVGVTLLEPDDDAASLLARVDRALYRAKDTGRNRVVSLDGDDDESSGVQEIAG